MNEKTLETHKMYRNGDTLSITINPSQQNFTCNNLNNRLLKFTTYWSGKLEACPASEFEFDLEMSKTGRLHWHGYVIVNDSLELGHWIGKLKELKNNIDLDTVGIIKTWKKYIRKDNEIFKKYTKLYRIYYPHKSISQSKQLYLKQNHSSDECDDDTE